MTESNKITILGSGTCQLKTSRIASSVLIEANGERILFDCGWGVCQRLVELNIDPNTIKYIVFSHYHPDHFSDLIPFLQGATWSRESPRISDLYLYGSPGLYNLMDNLYNLCSKEAISSERFKLTVTEYNTGDMHIGNTLCEFSSLPPAGNFGMKFKLSGKQVAITGDSSFHQEEVQFLKGVDVAIIDAGHLVVEEIIQLAVAAQPKSLYCSHIYAELNESELFQQAKSAGYKGQLFVCYDKMAINL